MCSRDVDSGLIELIICVVALVILVAWINSAEQRSKTDAEALARTIGGTVDREFPYGGRAVYFVRDKHGRRVDIQ